MESYDAVVVGAGPAGGQCARKLAQAGKKVLIVEKAKDFSVNNYSSGGAPLDIMASYDLPDNLVSAQWNRFSLYSSHESQHWSADQPKGVVLDFKKLRSFLCDDAVRNGGTLFLNSSYLSHERQGQATCVAIQRHDAREQVKVKTAVLVDATGSERKVLTKERYDKQAAMAATGIEYHLKISPELYHKYAHTLSFYIGHSWMPQGYAWIFPFEANVLKVGVVRFFLHQQFVPHHPSVNHYLQEMVKRSFGSSQAAIVEKHGKTIYYTYGQKDLLHHQNVIAIGDAISALNPLAAEGIRHAMASGTIAAQHILDFQHNDRAFDAYAQAMRRYFRFKWHLSEWIMHSIYREKEDARIDLILKTFQRFSFDDLLKLGFSYEIKKALKFYATLSRLSLLQKLLYQR